MTFSGLASPVMALAPSTMSPPVSVKSSNELLDVVLDLAGGAGDHERPGVAPEAQVVAARPP